MQFPSTSLSQDFRWTQNQLLWELRDIYNIPSPWPCAVGHSCPHTQTPGEEVIQGVKGRGWGPWGLREPPQAPGLSSLPSLAGWDPSPPLSLHTHPDLLDPAGNLRFSCPPYPRTLFLPAVEQGRNHWIKEVSPPKWIVHYYSGGLLPYPKEVTSDGQCRDL